VQRQDKLQPELLVVSVLLEFAQDMMMVIEM